MAGGIKPRARMNTKPKRKNLRSRTPERAKEERIYANQARDYIQWMQSYFRQCPVVCTIPELYEKHFPCHVTEIHHKRGRRGKLLLDKRYWMPVSRVGHQWIHAHPKEAKERGWLGLWGKQDQQLNENELRQT